MSATTTERPPVNGAEKPESKSAKVPMMDQLIEYVPLGEREPIKLSVALAMQYLMPPTKKGRTATKEQALKFVMLCRAGELNPWVGDAYAVGYDVDETAEYNLITSVQALFKRAERHPEYDGVESGVILRIKKEAGSEIVFREGDFFAEGETLLGGWAKVYRKDCGRPSYEAVKLATFNKGISVWKSNPEGMISKTAEAGALRKAFPNQLAGLYLREEIDAMRTVDTPEAPKVVTDLDALTNELKEKQSRKAIEHKADSEPSFAEQMQRQRAAEDAASVPKETVTPAAGATETAVAAEPDIVEDYKRQIGECTDGVDLHLLSASIKKSKALNDDERRFLLGHVKVKSQHLDD